MLLVSSRETLSSLTLLLSHEFVCSRVTSLFASYFVSSDVTVRVGWLVDCKKDVGLSIKIVPDCVKVILVQPCLLQFQVHS